MDRTIDQLVADINKLHETRFHFHANLYQVGDSAHRFAEFIGIVARDLSSNVKFYRSAVDMADELSHFSLDFPGQNVLMTYAIGPNGIVVKYADDNMIPARFPCLEGADEHLYDGTRKIVAYAKFGLLNVAFPERPHTRRFVLAQ